MKLLKIFSTIGIVAGVSLLSFASYIHFSSKIETPEKSKALTEIQSDIHTGNDTDGVQTKEEEISDSFSSQPISTESTASVDTIKNNNTVKDTKLSQSAWIPYWGFNAGFESLKQNKNIIDTVNPVLYSINANGKLQRNNISEQQLQEFLQFTQQNNIRVIPTVSSNNFANMDKLFSSTENYQQNIKDIMIEVNKYNFDGIDLDYEAINTIHKEKYIDYLTSLKQSLGSRIFSVTVLPKWRNAKYNERVETRDVQDYEKIANIVNELRIMTYDYTSPSSPVAGAIAPITWMEEVIKYCKEIGLPMKKIYLGIHLYSYEWSNGKISALTNTTVKNITEKIGSLATYNTEIAEGYAQYTCRNNNVCTLYYQTKQGILERKNLSKRYSLKGVAYWRIGEENDILK